MMAQCWTRFPNASFVPCDEITVLEDTATGWPGKCNMMRPHEVEEPVIQNCKQACYADPECSGWQVNHLGDCYHGLGENCWTNPTWDGQGIRPKAGQRLMHGTFRPLKKWTGVQILGLRNVFDDSNAKKMKESGEDPAQNCKSVCLSKIRCQYWQMDDVSGCWIEDPIDDCWVDDPSAKVECKYNHHSARVVPYPLTKSALVMNAASAGESEFIQRFCDSYGVKEAAPQPPPSPPPPLPQAPPKASTEMRTDSKRFSRSSWWLLLIGIALVSVGLAVYCGSNPDGDDESDDDDELGRRSVQARDLNYKGVSQFDEMDLNHDGKLNRQEFETGMVFNAIDKNHDGKISREEFEMAYKK